MSYSVTWTPCADLSPQRTLCPYFGASASGITSIVLRRVTMAGGMIVEDLDTVESVSSTTLTDIEPGSYNALPDYPTGSSLYISECDVIETVSFPNLVNVGESVTITSCPLLTSINLNSLEKCGFFNDDPSSGYFELSISFNNALTSISLPAFIDFDDPTQASFTQVSIENNPLLTTVSMPAFLPNNGISVLFRTNALNQASVDHILARCVANAAFVSGEVRLNGGTNAAPSVAGAADKATLIGRGVTVVTN